MSADIQSAARALALSPDNPHAQEAMRRALARRDFARLDPHLEGWAKTVLLADLVIRAARTGGYDAPVRVQPEGGGLRLRVGDLVDATVDVDGVLAHVDGVCVNGCDEHGDYVPIEDDDPADLDRITDAVREAVAHRALTLREERHELTRVEEVAVMMAAGGQGVTSALTRAAGAGASWRWSGGSPYLITLTATEEGHAAVRAYIAAAIDELRALMPQA
jgi:hypothetical protein